MIKYKINVLLNYLASLLYAKSSVKYEETSIFLDETSKFDLTQKQNLERERERQDLQIQRFQVVKGKCRTDVTRELTSKMRAIFII